MKKLEIFLPGHLNTNEYIAYQRLVGVLKMLNSEGIDVFVFNERQDLEIFEAHPFLQQINQSEDKISLPIIIVDNDIKMIGSIPRPSELGGWTGWPEEEFISKMLLIYGGCNGGGCCG